MTNKIKYNNIFMESFSVNESSLDSLEYNSIPEWDSIGHMGLMTELEDVFEIEMEMDDIVDFSSYKRGIEIMSKHNIEVQ
jgi:acyl carrier protein